MGDRGVPRVRKASHLGQARGPPWSAFDDPANMARTFTYRSVSGPPCCWSARCSRTPLTATRTSLPLWRPGRTRPRLSASSSTIACRRAAVSRRPAAVTLAALPNRLLRGPPQRRPNADGERFLYFWVATAACDSRGPPEPSTVSGDSVGRLRPGLAPLTPEDIALPALKWVMLTGTLLVVGSLITALREQVERLLRQLGSVVLN